MSTGTERICLHLPDDTHDPECCDHDEIVNGICQDCGEQHGPITITVTLAGLPANCPHCGASPSDGQWALGSFGGLLNVICPLCFSTLAPVRAVAS